MKLSRRLILFTLILIALQTTCKLCFGAREGWSGFSPLFAIAIFSGFIIKQKDWSFVLPLLALFLSDVAIQIFYSQNLFPYSGFYTGQWKNYLIILSVTLIGWLLRGRSKYSLGIGAVAAPTAFFLLSNFSVWLGTTEAIYTKDFSGLMKCYAAGLPFYKNALIATIVFLPGILLLYNYMTKNKAALTVA